MRVVLDTNIFISALLTPKGLPSQVLRLWFENRYDLVTSSWQIEELRAVSRRDKIKERVKAADVGTLVNNLRSKALVIDELPSVSYSPDPDDDNIIAAALAARAHYIVSRDKDDVLELGKVEGVRMLTVREFVRLFRKPVQ